MSSNSHKFPTPETLTKPSDLFFAYYFKDEVDGWIKRCEEDFPYPKISRYPTPEKVADELLGYAVAVKNWHTKWFEQFRGGDE